MVSVEISAPKARVWPLKRFLFTGLFVIVTLFLMLYQLTDYPVPWYDEGSHLHVAKNFALYGVYADSSSEGYRALGPTIGVGPTVLLPIAALFRFIAVSIPLARLVIVIYSLLTLLIIYAIALRITSWPYALLAVTLVLTTSSIRYLYFSRTVVGEVPGMFFFLLGLGLWLHPRGRSVPALIGVGVLIGLATMTKNQYALFILPGMLLCFIADLVWYKKYTPRFFIIPGLISGLMFGAWLYIVMIKLGQGSHFMDDLATLQKASTGALIVVDKDSLARVAGVLSASNLYGALFIPAFLYAILNSIRRDEQGQRRGILAIFLVLSTLLFVVSVGWDRYAFSPAVFVLFFVVLLIRDLVSMIAFDKLSLRQIMRKSKPSVSLIIGSLLVGWFIIAVIIPFYDRFEDVSTGGNKDVYQVADWIKANIPQSTLIETWEQELGVLTNNTFHYPPQLILAYSVAEQWQHGNPANKFYDFRDYGNPVYLIQGPFGVYTNIYPEDRLKDYEVVNSIGSYQIYRRSS